MEFVRNERKYTVADGYEWFWNDFASGKWEPSTFRIFDKFLKPDDRMLDIGAWIGPTALYASQKVKEIFAFEPDPIAYHGLIQNLSLNNTKNVVPYPIAVSDDWKGLNFGIKNRLGDSMSSELWAHKDGMQVPAVPFEALIVDIEPDFIKIDIEGGEKFIFKGSALMLETLKPTIHLSLHTPWMTEDLEGFKNAIKAGIGFYPYFYDENLNRIELDDVFSVSAFNAVVATYTEIV